MIAQLVERTIQDRIAEYADTLAEKLTDATFRNQLFDLSEDANMGRKIEQARTKLYSIISRTLNLDKTERVYAKHIFCEAYKIHAGYDW